ncbi:MAG: MBL fold metallo-hydrolase [Deltaproteobacteria bacterium]|nr:MBL fold metallo-hydrolase [Deltaproteobacteria bacterium]
MGIISTGFIPVARQYMCEGSPPGTIRIPSLAFLIEHPARKILFDLGLPAFLAAPGRSRLAPLVPVAKLMGMLPEVIRGEDAASRLKAAGVDPADIGTVIYSHHHFDHTGDIDRFPDADVVVGPGVFRLARSWRRHLRGLNPADLPGGRTREAPLGKGPKLGPFISTWDLMNDGSIYLVDLPGHCTGSLGALIHLASGRALLAGDGVYIRDNYRLPAPKGVLYGRSADEDRKRAWQTILEIRELSARVPEIHIWPSHEPELVRELPQYPELVE